MKPRICMVVHANYPLGETRVQREAMALTAEGFDVSVVCLRGEREPAKETIDGVQVSRLPVRRRRGSGMLWQAFEYLRFLIQSAVWLSAAHVRRRFDVIQVHTPPDALVFAATLPKLMGAKVVLDIHDLLPEFFAARKGWSLDHPVLAAVRAEERFSCWFADRVITVTSHWRDDLERRGVPSRKLAVVMNLADPSLFQDAGSSFVDDERFVVLYHGTFTERYGVDLLVNAAAKLRDEIPGLEVRLVGDGEQREALTQLIDHLQVGDLVEVSRGMVGPDRLAEVLASADIGIVPNRSSVFTEGLLPTKLLEYVLTGTPAVVADTAGIRRYFSDAMVAYFTPGEVDALAECILTLWRDTDLRLALPANAQEFNRTHSWERDSRVYVEMIEELIGGGPVKADVGAADEGRL